MLYATLQEIDIQENILMESSQSICVITGMSISWQILGHRPNSGKLQLELQKQFLS